MAVIQDPTSGNTASVDDNNRLSTFAVAQPETKCTNIEGLSNSLFFEVVPTGANDKFFYLENTGVQDLSITSIRISSSVATNILIKKVTGTPSAGSAAAVTNRNLGNVTAPDITATFAVDITGLTDDGVLFFQECPDADTMEVLRIASNIIIPQGQALAFERVAATGDITCLVSLTRTSG